MLRVATSRAAVNARALSGAAARPAVAQIGDVIFPRSGAGLDPEFNWKLGGESKISPRNACFRNAERKVIINKVAGKFNKAKAVVAANVATATDVPVTVATSEDSSKAFFTAFGDVRRALNSSFVDAVFVQDAPSKVAGASVRVVTSSPEVALHVKNVFEGATTANVSSFTPDLTVLAAPVVPEQESAGVYISPGDATAVVVGDVDGSVVMKAVETLAAAVLPANGVLPVVGSVAGPADAATVSLAGKSTAKDVAGSFGVWDSASGVFESMSVGAEGVEGKHGLVRGNVKVGSVSSPAAVTAVKAVKGAKGYGAKVGAALPAAAQKDIDTLAAKFTKA